MLYLLVKVVLVAYSFGSASKGGDDGLFYLWVVAGVVMDILVSVGGFSVDRGAEAICCGMEGNV